MGAELLTEKQRRFCEEYMLDFNGTQAAIRAGYSPDSANEIASQNLAKLNVAAYLSELKSQAAEQFGVSKSQLINELKKTAFFDIRTIYDESNALLNVRDFDNNAAGAVAGIEVDEIWEGPPGSKTLVGHTSKVKMNSKLAAIERISKMLGYDAPTQSEIAGANGAPIQFVFNPAPGNEPLPND
jgi:phage terminase small subunit